MINLLRTMTSRTKPEPKDWLAGQFGQSPHPMADKAIAAWSEFMGRDSAELWLAASRDRTPQ